MMLNQKQPQFKKPFSGKTNAYRQPEDSRNQVNHMLYGQPMQGSLPSNQKNIAGGSYTNPMNG